MLEDILDGDRDTFVEALDLIHLALVLGVVVSGVSPSVGTGVLDHREESCIGLVRHRIHLVDGVSDHLRPARIVGADRAVDHVASVRGCCLVVGSVGCP